MLSDFVANVRRNHALEHATVSLLLGRLGPDLRLVGRASGDGFFIYGDIPQRPLGQCAQEGLARLKRGEAFWAVTPLCGTNIATAGVLAGLSTLAVTSAAAAQGPRQQRHPRGHARRRRRAAPGPPDPALLTTSPDLADTEIVAIESGASGRFHKVRTRRQAVASGLVAHHASL